MLAPKGNNSITNAFQMEINILNFVYEIGANLEWNDHFATHLTINYNKEL